jgi:hypothetical protein
MATGRKTGGRTKGTLNKNPALREMILQALERNGGVEYLATVAVEQPVAFCGLLGKVLPTQLTGENGGPIRHEFAWSDGDDDRADIASTVAEFAVGASDATH